MDTEFIYLMIAFGIIMISFILRSFLTTTKNTKRSSSISERYNPWNDPNMPFPLAWGGKIHKKKIRYFKN